MIGMKVLSAMWLVMRAASVIRNDGFVDSKPVESPIRGAPKTKRVEADADGAARPIRKENIPRSVAADGGVKVSNGLVDSTPVESPIREVRKTKLVEVEADGDIQVPTKNAVGSSRKRVNDVHGDLAVSPGGGVSVEQSDTSRGHEKMSASLQKRAEAAQPVALKQVTVSDEATSALVKINDAFKSRAQLDVAEVTDFFTSFITVILTSAEILATDPENRSLDAMEESLMVINTGIWDCLIALLPENETNATSAFREVWDEAFAEFFNVSDEVKPKIEEYEETGNATLFGEAVKAIVTFAANTIADFLPEASDNMDALEVLVNGLVDSWVDIQNGDQVGSLMSLWDGATNSIDVLIPGLENNTNYQTIVQGLDPTISNLNTIIAEFEELKQSSQICYQLKVTTKSVVPSSCPEGYTMKGLHCHPPANAGADCWDSCGKKDGMCPEVCGTGRACCKKGKEDAACECNNATEYIVEDGQKGSAYDYHQCVKPGNMVPNAKYSPLEVSVERKKKNTETPEPKCVAASTSDAMAATSADAMIDRAVQPKGNKETQAYGTVGPTCNASSNYTWHCGSRCYKECPESYHRDGCSCKQPCQAPFPYDYVYTPGMCAAQPGLLQAWLLETSLALVTTGVELYNMAQENANNTGEGELPFDHEDLSSTIDSLIGFAKHFAHLPCPDAADYVSS